MFSNGKFKNIVAEVDISKQIGPGEVMHGVYSLLPVRGKLFLYNIRAAWLLIINTNFFCVCEQVQQKIG